MGKLHLQPGESLHEKEDLRDCLNSKIEFNEAYILGEEIAAGSFGTVYYTHHVSTADHDLKKQYAVKIIERSGGKNDEEAIHESSIMRDLRNVPNVIQLQDFYMDKKNLYIVQDLALGGDVFDRLALKDTYTEKDARNLCSNLITTIGYIHRSEIIHRDLKPENLLLKALDDDESILVCDFGLAARLPSNKEEGFTSMCGTAAYTAPEIINGPAYREKVDIWAVGCIMFVLLGGYLPFGDSEDGDIFDRILNGDFDFKDEQWDFVSGSAKKLIEKLLEPEADDRITISEALSSRWFKKCPRMLSKVSLGGSLRKIKGIVRKRKLRGVVDVVIATKRLSLEFSKN